MFCTFFEYIFSFLRHLSRINKFEKFQKEIETKMVTIAKLRPVVSNQTLFAPFSLLFLCS